MPTGNSYKAPIGVTHKPSAGTPEYRLRQLLEDVKDSEGNVFFVADNTLHQKEQISFVSEAMNKIITQQTDVLDAMCRPDIGSISWGSPGAGSKFKKGSNGKDLHMTARQNEKNTHMSMQGTCSPEQGVSGVEGRSHL